MFNRLQGILSLAFFFEISHAQTLSISATITEVKAQKKSSTWDSRWTRFVEIYNDGNAGFTLDEIVMTGLISMSSGSSSVLIAKGQYAVFYDASDEPLGLSTVGSTPSCHLCEWYDSTTGDVLCNLASCADTSRYYTGYCFCSNAVYIACRNAGDGSTGCINNIGITGAKNECSTCKFNDGMGATDWSITISQASNSQVIDSVVYGAFSTWFTPIDGYSLELAWRGLDNTYGTSWITSCYVYGTPGSGPLSYCPETCVNQDSDCSGGNNYCDPGTGYCVCDIGWYPPQCVSTSTCFKCDYLPEVEECNVYFKEEYAYFNWTVDRYSNDGVFVLTYFDGNKSCGADPQGNEYVGGGSDSNICDVTTDSPAEIWWPYYQYYNYYEYNTTVSGYVQFKINVDGNDYSSAKTWCIVNLPPTQSPTTELPTTSMPTTAQPTTLNPTYGPTNEPTLEPTTLEPSNDPTSDPTKTKEPSASPTVGENIGNTSDASCFMIIIADMIALSFVLANI